MKNNNRPQISRSARESRMDETVVAMAMAMVVVMRMRMMMVLITMATTMATTMAMRREVKESQAAGATTLFYFTFRATVSAVASIHNINFQPCEFHNIINIYLHF